jgi:hypothetical protein
MLVFAKVSDSTYNFSLQLIGEHTYSAGVLVLTATVISDTDIPVHKINISPVSTVITISPSTIPAGISIVTLSVIVKY